MTTRTPPAVRKRPATYLEFCASLGIRLTAAQRVLAKVAFDGVEPGALEGEELALARKMLGPVDAYPVGCREIFVAVAGARGGKTYTLLAIRCLHLALTVDLSHLAAGEVGFGAIVSPGRGVGATRLAMQAIRFIRGAIRESPAIRKLVVSGLDGDSATIELVRQDGANAGRHIMIAVVAAAAGGGAVRARSYFFVGLDEACFFYADDGHTVTDRAIYEAAETRIEPGGQLAIVSTPNLEEGLTYELFRKNHPNPGVAIDGEPPPGTPQDCVAAHADTLTLHPSEQNKRRVERGYRVNPDNAERELGARFVSKGSSRWFDPETIAACQAARAAELMPVTGVRPIAVAALDLGFVDDPSALVVVRNEDVDARGRHRVVAIEKRRGKKGAPLKPAATIRELLAVAISQGCRVVWADGHYYAAILEVVAGDEDNDPLPIAVEQGPTGAQGNLDVYSAARDALADGSAELSHEHVELAEQLRAKLGKRTPTGGWRIWTARTKSGHGDIASAWALAVYAARRMGFAARAIGSVVGAPVTRKAGRDTRGYGSLSGAGRGYPG